MRAVVHDRYGPPEVLRVTEVERPAPKEDEVLVRVHASTVTRTDTGLRNTEYPFTRLITGVRRPRRTIAGTEFAGVVEEVGAAVTEFRLGDEVFGFEGGANAEYVTVRESGVIAPKPAELTFEQAAAVPDGSLLALTFIPAGLRRRASSSTAPRARSEPRSSSSSCTTSGRTSRRCATGRTSSSCSRSARGRSTIVFARTSRAAVRRMT